MTSWSGPLVKVAVIDGLHRHRPPVPVACFGSATPFVVPLSCTV